MRQLSFKRHRFPADIIRHSVWLYARFTLSYRDVEEMLAERGLDISYETVRRWFLKFGSTIAANLRRIRPRPSDHWHLDESAPLVPSVTVAGQIFGPGRKPASPAVTGVHRGTLSDRYGAALDLAQGGDTAAGLNGLIDLSEPDAGGYAGLAAFEEARLRAESGDIEGAIRVWDRLAAGSGLSEGFRNVAEVLSVMHQIDSGDATVLRGRLEPLAVDGEPFRATARELLAPIALRRGDRAGARELYTRIADDREAPSGLRARATQMLAALKD